MRSSRARFAAVRWGSFALIFGLAAGWSPVRSTAEARALPQTVAAPGAPAPAAGEHGGGRKGDGQFRDSAVYVDGKAVGVLDFAELPPGLTPVALPELDRLDIPRYYKLGDYLTQAGVDVSRIRELHVYGSHDRVAIITGEAFRAVADRMMFDFTQQVAGKPRARWSQLHALPHSPMVDVILAVSVYIDRTPPTYEHGDLLVDGKPTTGIPYVDDGVPKGTRVYVDGTLSGWVRRKALPDSLIAPGSERVHASFSTDAFLGYVGADSRKATAVDFYNGSALLARVDAKAWARSKGDYVFDLPTRSHGQVHESFPGDQKARVTSIRLYVRSAPPARKVQPDAFEPQGGSEDTQNGGGNGDGTGGNSGVTPVAQSVKGDPSEEF